MKVFYPVIGLSLLLSTLFCVLPTNQIKAQKGDPIFDNNFDEDMGIWTTSYSAQISSADGSDDKWLMLQKGTNGGGQPSITSSPIYLKDYCSVRLTFDFLAVNAQPEEMVYVQVSSDGGQSFQFLREANESLMLANKTNYYNETQNRFVFPIRGFLSDSLLLRISTHNLSNESKIYLDNIMLEGTDDEDYLLAYWQMGNSSSSDMEYKLEPRFEKGNCGGVTAFPIDIPKDMEHFGVAGYTYNSIPVSNDPTLPPSDGGLCVDFKNNEEEEGLTFTVIMSPEEKGRISGFEFMEQAPINVDGGLNNYPTKFEVKVYSEDKLIFSQSNISTSRLWSDRTFRLAHINEFIVKEPTEFTFHITPSQPVGNKGGMSVWIVDEVKVLGGCCDKDCDLVELEIDEHRTEDGMILTPNITRGPGCLEPCAGSITNENGETVSLVTNQSTGWSYYNNATTIVNDDVDMALPRSYKTHSFRLEATGDDQPQYLQSDIINLCPGETYSVCFEHLSTDSNSDTGILLSVSDKRALVTSQDIVDQTCMSFVATKSNERISLATTENQNKETAFYLDNIEVESIQTSEEIEINVIWNGDKATDPVLPQLSMQTPSNFYITGKIDTTATYRKKSLYSLCFGAVSKANTSDVEKIRVRIDGNIEKDLTHDLSIDEHCLEFLTNQRNHSVEYELIDKDGAIIEEEKLVLTNLKVLLDSIDTGPQPIEGLSWTLPDGTKTTESQITAEQKGDYYLEYSNCFECVKSELLTNELNFDVCPPNAIIACDASIDPELNSELSLIIPDAPYDLGSNQYEDQFQVNMIFRSWTIERLYKGIGFDTIKCTQLIELIDEVKPEIPKFTDTKLVCIKDLPEPEEFKTEDNCSEQISLISEDVITEGTGCPDNPIVISRFWTATDESGNSSTEEQKFIVVHEPPIIVCPRSRNIICESDISASELNVTWPCVERELNYTTEVKLNTGAAGCNGARYDMTYTITDDCNRTSHCIQSFFLYGQDLEIICPASEVVSCIEDFSHSTPDHNSTCDHSVSYSYDPPVLANGEAQCNGSIYEVVYSIISDCNETSSCIQEIEISNAGMTLACPANEVVTCPSDITVGTPFITTSCNVSYEYSYDSPTLISGIEECIGAVYAITYTAIDLCGQQIACAQHFTINNPGLSISCPEDYTVSCYGDIYSATPEITSYCNSAPEFSVSQSMAINSAFSCDGEVYVLEYTAFNQCGDYSSCIQQVNLSNAGPSMTCPSNKVVQCLADISSEVPSVSSPCNVSYFLDVSLPILTSGLNNCNGSTYQLTYELEDDCGNQLSCNQIFTLDNQSISILCPPDITVFEFEDIHASEPSVLESCNLDYTVSSHTPELISINCTLAEFKIVYTVTGTCGDEASCEQTLILSDDYNAIDGEYICANPDLFVGLDCDNGGIDDIEECDDGTDPEDPCDDVNFIVDVTDVLCFGDNTGSVSVISQGGNPPYEFSLNNSNWSLSGSFFNLTTGDYTVYVRNTYGPNCFFNFDFRVSEPPLSPADAGIDQEICLGSSTQLTATGGTTYLWSTGESSQIITVSPTTTSTYSVTVTQANGCYNSDQVTVIVHENNSAVAGPDQEICINSTATLVAGGGVSYLWSNGETHPIIEISPPQTTTYTVTITDENGCTDIADAQVIVNSNDNADAGPDKTICIYEETELVASGGISYLWSTGETTSTITVSPNTQTTYNITVTDINGCTDTDQVTVFVNDLPTADAGADTQICLNENTTLTATGGTTYLWDNGLTTSSITVNPTTTSSYAVTVTDANGCTETDMVEVTVYYLPVAIVIPDQDLCFGNTTTLSASGGVSYLWSTGETTAAISVTPATTTSYQVTVTSAEGCTDQNETTVHILDLPPADAGPDQSICLNDEAALTASGGTTYLWSTGATSSSLVVAPSSQTNYTVTVTDANGCSATDQVTVFVNDLPTADAGADTQICLNESTTLTATGGTTYLWDNGQTTSSIVVNPATTSSYAVTVTDANGCTDTDMVEVTVYDLPVAVVIPDQEVCFGNTATLSATGGVSYLWSTGETTAAISVTPATTTSYQVTVTSAEGCTDQNETTVHILDLPPADAGPDQSICLNDEAALTASGGTTYLWSTGATSSSLVVAPSSQTNYTVTVTDANGCSATDQVTVFVNDLPTADAGADTQICLNESTTLTATGGTTYLWDNGQTTSSIVVNPTTTSSYAITVTDANGCTDTDMVEVTVYDLPVAVVIPDQDLCFGNTATLSASGGVSYLWSTGETTAAISVTPATTTSYQVTVTSAEGCTDQNETTVHILDLPPADAGSDDNICIGDESELVASGGSSYLWSTGATTFNTFVAPLTDMNYTVTVTDDNGCSATDEVMVYVHDLPTADAGNDMQICNEDTATLYASGGITYEWSNSETSSSINVTPNTSTIYTVTVTDSNGCTDTDEVEVIVLDLPIITISDNIDICPEETATLTATGGTTYFWSTAEITSSITVTPASTTSYQVTVTNSEGCSDTAETTVNVLAPPTADAGVDQNICIGNNTNLVASGGSTYLWSTGQSTATIIVEPQYNSIFTVTVTDDDGCTATDEVEIFVHDPPVADLTPWAVVCGTTPTILTASGGTNYQWSTGETTASIAVAPIGYQVYTVTVSDDYGCTDEADVSVYVVTPPPIYAGDDQYLCPGGEAYLYAYGGDQYEWTPNLFLNTNTGPYVISTPDSTITYTLTSTDESGCTVSDQVTIHIVDDTVPPEAWCQDIAVDADDNGVAELNPFFIDDESWDNCGPVTLTLDTTTIACLLQDYTITLTVTDEAGNTDTCQSTVTLMGPDDDCDLYADGCDLCDGGDDSVDNDNNGLPDCYDPPVNYVDLEDYWKCGTNSAGEQKAWICHYPHQSICLDYSEIYTHLGYHNDDYLGPCHSASCYYDKPVTEEDLRETWNSGAKEGIQLKCQPKITDLNYSNDNILDKLKATVEVIVNDCELESFDLDYTEKEVALALTRGDVFEITFTAKDECNNVRSCSSEVDIDSDELVMFPNPTRDFIKLSGLNDENYRVFDTKGKLVISSQNELTIDASSLDVGIYILLTNSGRSYRFLVMD